MLQASSSCELRWESLTAFDQCGNWEVKAKEIWQVGVLLMAEHNGRCKVLVMSVMYVSDVIGVRKLKPDDIALQVALHCMEYLFVGSAWQKLSRGWLLLDL